MDSIERCVGRWRWCMESGDSVWRVLRDELIDGYSVSIDEEWIDVYGIYTCIYMYIRI